MQRSKPYRPRPTPGFMNLFDIAQTMRMYLVQENGPTKLVLEDSEHKKFKVQIGSEVTCTCGGGKLEHCAHTIYALNKIFKISDGDPLLWQLSYLDSEISRILQNRLSAQSTNAQRLREIEEQKLVKYKDGKKIDKREKVSRQKLDAEETCCVCYEVMKEEENLTFCKYGCGRNIHTDCIEVWVKHKLSVAQKITCPLCRIDWGPNALDDLKEETKNFKEHQKEKKSKKSKNDDNADRSFKCYCCKRTLIYEAKLQCVLCANVEICKLCFSGKYHDHHDFMMRPAPDKDWEAAFRGNASQYNDDYVRLMQELQNREIRPEDYDLLLQLEQSSQKVPLPKYLAQVFDKANPPTEEYLNNAQVMCAFCSGRIDDKTKGLQLKNCNHCLHKNCLEDMFRLKKSKCLLCDKVIADGFEKSLQIVRRKPKKDLKKKQLEETKVKVLQEIQERSQPVSFGIAGVGITGNQIEMVDPRQLYSQNQTQQQFIIRQRGVKPNMNGKIYGPKSKILPEQVSDLNFGLNGRKITANQLDETQSNQERIFSNNTNQIRRGLSQQPVKRIIANQLMQIEAANPNQNQNTILPSSSHFTNFMNQNNQRENFPPNVNQQKLIKPNNTKLRIKKDIQEYDRLNNNQISQFGINGNGLGGLQIGNDFQENPAQTSIQNQGQRGGKKQIYSQRPPRKAAGVLGRRENSQLDNNPLLLNAQSILQTNPIRLPKNNANRSSQNNDLHLPPLSSHSRRSTQQTSQISNQSQNQNNFQNNISNYQMRQRHSHYENHKQEYSEDEEDKNSQEETNNSSGWKRVTSQAQSNKNLTVSKVIATTNKNILIMMVMVKKITNKNMRVIMNRLLEWV
eukprot:403365789